ncbi:uncharacterized protein LOC144653800 [Oculina patagonica]
METSSRNGQKTPKSSTPHEFFSPRTSPTPEQDGLSTPEDTSPQKSPSSAKRLKSFFQDLQRESRHALTNKKAKIVQLWEGRRWRRMSAEEVEPFAEMEEKELLSYGATELYNAKHENNNDGHSAVNGGKTDRVVENRA